MVRRPLPQSRKRDRRGCVELATRTFGNAHSAGRYGCGDLQHYGNPGAHRQEQSHGSFHLRFDDANSVSVEGLGDMTYTAPAAAQTRRCCQAEEPAVAGEGSAGKLWTIQRE